MRVKGRGIGTQRLRKLFKCNLRTDVLRMTLQGIFADSRKISCLSHQRLLFYKYMFITEKLPHSFDLKKIKLRCLQVKHISRATGMWWRTARRRVWHTEGAASYLWQGKADGRGASVCGLAPLEAVTAPWSVQPNRYVDEKTTQVGGDKGLTVCLCKRSHEGERVTRQFFHNTLSTAHENNGTWPTSLKKAVSLPCHAGLSCKRSIAILSALRACEGGSITIPGGSK